MQGRDCAYGPGNRARLPIHAMRWLAAFALAAGLAQSACSHQPEVAIHAGDKTVRVRVEFALTPEEQQRGLMYRQDLPKDGGMLFVFPETQIQSFWMKNTPLPLDMIFIDEDKEIVGIVENAVPFSTTGRMVATPSRYVLEVHGGFSAQHGIKAGQAVELPVIPATK